MDDFTGCVYLPTEENSLSSKMIHQNDNVFTTELDKQLLQGAL